MTTKRFLTFTVLAVGFFVLGMPFQSRAQLGYGGHPGMYRDHEQGGDWNYCPYCGGRLHHRGGYGMNPYGGMGHGMMQPGYDRPYGAYRGERREPVKEKEARNIVEDMLRRSRNPNLKAGAVEDKEKVFVVDVLTRDGSLVDKIEVDKDTGLMRSAY